MIGPAEARHTLAGFATGLTDAGDLRDTPMVLVDVSEGGAGDLEVPLGFPAVVVAWGGRSAPELRPGGPDVAVTTLAGAPAPWVAVPDGPAGLAHLEARIAHSPVAAVVLAEVLRATRGVPVATGLLVESLAYSTLQGGPEFAAWRRGRPDRPARPPSPGRVVRAARSGRRLEIVLNRPEVHNAYNRHMRDQLFEALAVVAADPDVDVHLSGAGPSFCSGGDLDEFGTFPDPAASHLVRTGRSPALLLAAVADRTEVVLHGSCAGSGIELAAFAARVAARPGTRMWLPELTMGLIPGAGGTVSIARRIGPPRTAWMALSGTPLDVATALEWGLVDAAID